MEGHPNPEEFKSELEHKFNCLKCKKSVTSSKYETKQNKKGRDYLSSECGDCKGKLSRFISNKPKPSSQNV
jgi:transcription elongation factor Elf1